MSWLWPPAVGQAGEAASGLKLVGGPHWKPATNKVSPAAPDRPLPVLFVALAGLRGAAAGRADPEDDAGHGEST